MRSRVLSSKRGSFRPRVEPLEGRWVPACTVVFSATGVTITGDNTANNITINDDGTGVIGGISVTCDGMTTSNTVAVTAFQFTIDTMGRADTVVYNLNGDLMTGQSRALGANLGDQNDTFVLTSASNVDLLTGTSLSMVVNGQRGRDNVFFDFSKDFDVFTGASGAASLSLVVSGGQERDKIAYTRDGTNDGVITLAFNGNQENDKISLYDNLDDLSDGTFSAQVKGQGGNDVLALVANKAQGFLGVTTGSMDGGPGNNVGIASNFVSIDNVQDPFQLPF